MYWSDWGVVPKIERARLDGSQREVFINESISHPYGLTLDYDTNTLYWCDQRLNKIEKVLLNGESKREVIVTNITDCMGLTVFGDYIYWTDM